MEWRWRSPARVSKSRWRQESNSVRVSKVESQNNSSSSPVRNPGQSVMFWSPWPHTDSVLDVLYMDGKLRRHVFQRRRSHAKIPSESTGIIETSRRPESAKMQDSPRRVRDRVPTTCVWRGRPTPFIYRGCAPSFTWVLICISFSYWTIAILHCFIIRTPPRVIFEIARF